MYPNKHYPGELASRKMIYTNIASLTYVSPIGDRSSINIKQAIIFENGFVKIGVDVWRELDKYDTSSHPVKCFKSIDELKEQYEIRSDLGFITHEYQSTRRKIYADFKHQ